MDTVEFGLRGGLCCPRASAPGRVAEGLPLAHRHTGKPCPCFPIAIATKLIRESTSILFFKNEALAFGTFGTTD